MLNLLNFKPEAFGLDISDLSLKLIKLKKKGKFLDLASVGQSKIEPGIVEGGEIKEEGALIELIKKSLEKIQGEKLKTKYVIASLPEEKGFLEVIQMPKMKEEELAQAIYFEAENYVPLPIKEVYLDYRIVPPLYNHLDHLDVLIAASPKKIINSYVDCLKKAGLIPLALEIESLAVARALVKDEKSLTPILLIDLGEVRTSLIIFAGSSLRFTTSLPISGQKFTEIIAKTLKITKEKAEEMKIKYGIKNSREEKAREIFEATIPILTDLVEQIQKYIDYYQAHAGHEHLPPNGKTVSYVLLCGGGANLKGLPEFLSSQLKLPVKCGNPWVNILAKPEEGTKLLAHERSLAFTCALGLALRGTKDYFSY